MILSLAIILTYFGWTAAQFVAIGLVLNLLAGIPILWSMVIAAVLTVIYTYLGVCGRCRLMTRYKWE